MPRKKAASESELIGVMPDESESRTEPQSLDELVETGFEGIKQILNEIGDHEGYAYLQRRPPEGDSWQSIPNRVSVANFDLRMIAKKFGGGDYKAKFHKSNGDYFGHKQFTIDHRIKGDLDRPEGASAPGDNQTFGQALEFVERMQRFNRPEKNDNQLLIAMIQAQSKQSEAMMLGLFQVMASMAGNKSDGIGLKEILPLIKPPDLADNLKVLKELKSMNAGDETAEPKEDMIERLLKMGLGAVANFAPPRLPSNEDNGSTPAAPSRPEISARLQRFAERCLRAADADRDPMPYWEQLADACDEDQMRQLKEFLGDPQWFEKLFQGKFTDNEQIRGWFEDLKKLVLSNGDEMVLESSNEPDSQQTDDNPEQRSAAPDQG